MRFIVTLSFVICLLLIVLQPFVREPFSYLFIVLDVLTGVLGIAVLVIYIPNPCRDRSYTQVMAVEQERV